MGMDVYGKNGGYFRNNCWWWRPLWNYCYEVAPEIISEDLFNRGHNNDGAGLDDKGSKELAHTLRYLLKSKQTKEYEKRYKAERKALPDIKCTYCNGTGIRKDVKCNVCKGKGTERPTETWYPFEADNVKMFAEFLEDCGGFEIC